MNNKKFFLAIFLIIILAAGGYGYLGGFNKPEIKKVVTSEIYLAGKPYYGSVKSEAFGNLFQEAGKLVEEKKLTGDLGGVYYNDPEKQSDTIKAFIGVIVPSPSVKLPAGYQIRTLAAGKPALQGDIDAHIMLAPNKIYPTLFHYAKENKLTLQDLYIERYPDTRHAQIIVLIK
jgi:hypothetical protein